MSRRRIPVAGRHVQGLFRRYLKGFKRKVDDVRRTTAAPSRTRPSRTANPNAAPRGSITPAHPTRKTDRGKRRENESAAVLSRHGYDVEQNPRPRWNGREPDYKIEGKYFDSYAPSTKDIDNVRDEMSKKVRDPKSGLLQADRIVLEMQDSPLSPDDVKAVLDRKPVKGLREVIVVEEGAPRWLLP